MKKIFVGMIILSLFFLLGCVAPENNIYRNLNKEDKEMGINFLQGDIEAGKDLTITAMVGNIKGGDTVNVNVLVGNIEDGNNITVNVLKGTILGGENIQVNELVGTNNTSEKTIKVNKVIE